MIKLKRFNKPEEDFVNLVQQLDAGLAITDGADNSFYDQFNGIEHLRNIVVAYKDDKPVGCGAFKNLEDKVVEIKRMFVPAEFRGNGIATLILIELESWALEIGKNKLVLETGKKQVEALIVYPKYGFKIIENYGQYVGVENSVCFGKHI